MRYVMPITNENIDKDGGKIAVAHVEVHIIPVYAWID
jgi:diadenosine tetraphosphate (Ap4A) HIT family hydrolase